VFSYVIVESAPYNLFMHVKPMKTYSTVPNKHKLFLVQLNDD